MNNIVLTGMPGAGKSTIGVLLAKVLGYKFVDADILIQDSQGMLLREIIAKYGDEGFLKIENDVNKGISIWRRIWSYTSTFRTRKSQTDLEI